MPCGEKKGPGHTGGFTLSLGVSAASGGLPVGGWMDGWCTVHISPKFNLISCISFDLH